LLDELTKKIKKHSKGLKKLTLALTKAGSYIEKIAIKVKNECKEQDNKIPEA
jgi:hypothetical protein